MLLIVLGFWILCACIGYLTAGLVGLAWGLILSIVLTLLVFSWSCW